MAQQLCKPIRILGLSMTPRLCLNKRARLHHFVLSRDSAPRFLRVTRLAFSGAHVANPAWTNAVLQTYILMCSVCEATDLCTVGGTFALPAAFGDRNAGTVPRLYFNSGSVLAQQPI